MIRRRSPSYYIDGGIIKPTVRASNFTTTDSVYGFDGGVAGGIEEKKEDCDSVRTASSTASVQRQQPIIDVLDNGPIRPSILLAAPAGPILNHQHHESNHPQHTTGANLMAPSSVSHIRHNNVYLQRYEDVVVDVDVDEKDVGEYVAGLRNYNRPLDEQYGDMRSARKTKDTNSTSTKRGGMQTRVEQIATVLFGSCCDSICASPNTNNDAGIDGTSTAQPLCSTDCLQHPEDWIFRLCTKHDSNYSTAQLSIAEELRQLGGRQKIGSNGQRPRSPRPTSPIENRQQQQYNYEHQVHKLQHQQAQQQHQVYDYRPDIPRYLAEQAVNSFEEDDNISAISQYTIDELTRQGLRHNPRVVRRIPTTDDAWATTDGSGLSEDLMGIVGGGGSNSSTNNIHQQHSGTPGGSGRGSARHQRIGSKRKQQKQPISQLNSDDDLFGERHVSGAVVSGRNNIANGIMNHNYYVPQSVPESNMEDSI